MRRFVFVPSKIRRVSQGCRGSAAQEAGRGASREAPLRLVAAVIVLAAGIDVSAGIASAARDTRPPSAPKITGPRITSNAAATYTFRARDRVTRAAKLRYRCALGSRPLKPCPSRYRARLGVGVNALRVQAVDRAGNRSRVTKIRVVRRASPPAKRPKLAVLATIPVGRVPLAIAEGGGSIWTANAEGGTVSRIDPVTNTVVATIQTGPVGDVTYGDNALWAADPSGRVLRIDPLTNTVMWSVQVGEQAIRIAVGFGALWASNQIGFKLLRVEESTGLVTDTISLPFQPRPVAIGTDAIWTAAGGSGAFRVDPSTRRVVGEISATGIVEMTAGNGAIWALARTSAFRPDIRVSRIDPATMSSASTTVNLENCAASGAFQLSLGLAHGAGALWAASGCTLIRLDETTRTPLAELVVPDHALTDAAFAAGSAWVTDATAHAVLRIAP